MITFLSSGFGVFLAAELRAAVSEEALEPEDSLDRFEAIDEFDFELAEPRDPSKIRNVMCDSTVCWRLYCKDLTILNKFLAKINLPSSSPSEGWILLDAIIEALRDASRASWTSLSSALASSDFAADDFAEDDELELLATEEAKIFL